MSAVNQIIARLKADMLASPVDDITVISRPQLEAIETAIAAARISTTWQGISTAPTDGDEIIARTGPEWPSFSCFWNGGAFVHYDHDDGYIRYNPTQWMPMPGPDAISSPDSKGRG